MRKLIALAVLSLAVPGIARDNVSSYDISRLCVLSDTLGLVVAVDEDAIGAGVGEDRLRTMLESRMRAARIYSGDPSSTPYLTATIDSFAQGSPGDAVIFAADLSMSQYMENTNVRIFRSYTSWDILRFGIGDGDFVMQHFSKVIDEFIGDFLRVNDSPECKDALESARAHSKIMGNVVYADPNDPVAQDFRAYLDLTPSQKEQVAEMSRDKRAHFFQAVEDVENMTPEQRKEYLALPVDQRPAFAAQFIADE